MLAHKLNGLQRSHAGFNEAHAHKHRCSARVRGNGSGNVPLLQNQARATGTYRPSPATQWTAMEGALFDSLSPLDFFFENTRSHKSSHASSTCCGGGSPSLNAISCTHATPDMAETQA